MSGRCRDRRCLDETTLAFAVAEFDFGGFPTAQEVVTRVSKKYEAAQNREKESRTIFAHHAIKAQEIEADLRETDDALGDPKAVESFVTAALPALFGVQVQPQGAGWVLYPTNLPAAARVHLPTENKVLVSFHSPTPRGYLYLGRNHPFVDQVCQSIMAASVDRLPPPSPRTARAAVFRSTSVEVVSTLCLCRVRNVIEEIKSSRQLVAEELLAWGWKGDPAKGDSIPPTEARHLLLTAEPTDNVPKERQARLLSEAVTGYDSLSDHTRHLAEARSQHLVQAHERFAQLVHHQRFQIVRPVLPMDLLGLYVVLPALSNSSPATPPQVPIVASSNADS